MKFKSTPRRHHSLSTVILQDKEIYVDDFPV